MNKQEKRRILKKIEKLKEDRINSEKVGEGEYYNGWEKGYDDCLDHLEEFIEDELGD